MTVRAFDRTILNPRERPLSSDINQMMSQLNQTVREMARSLFLPHPSNAYDVASGFTPLSGFLGDGLMVLTPASGMVVTVKAGLGFLWDTGKLAASIDGVSGLDDSAGYYPCYLASDMSIALDAAPSAGNERYDIIEVSLDRRRQDTASRDVLNPSTGIFEPTSLLKTLAYYLDGRNGRVGPGGGSSTAGVSYKVGTAAATGTATPPSVTSGYAKLATIYVGSGVSSIAQNRIVDTRQMIQPGGGVLPFAFRVVHTVGTPDVVAVQTLPGCPAGMRVFARALGSAGGEVKFYVVCGGHYSMGHAPSVVALDQIMQGSVGSPGATSIVANVTAPAAARMTTGELALMDANAQAALYAHATYGQDYITFSAVPITTELGPFTHNLSGFITFA